MTVAADTDLSSFLFWYDVAPTVDVLAALKDYQRVNHFPETSEITRKDGLARNLNLMQKHFPGEYNFYPRSWILPAQDSAFRAYADDLKRKGKSRTFITKPVASAQGKGISLTRSASQVGSEEQLLVQEYMSHPFLIDGYKFDLRIYVLVTSCEPLRAFMYNDGLVRLSTSRYKAPSSSNIDQLFMHLTNYSVNKNSEDFDRAQGIDQGSKRTIKWLNEWLTANGHDPVTLWQKVAHIINKTVGDYSSVVFVCVSIFFGF